MKPSVIKQRGLRSNGRPESRAGAVRNGVIRKVVAIGGSAGAIQGLCQVLERLPPEMSAALLGVIHMGEGANHLPQVLQRCDSLKVVVPEPAEPLAPARLYLPLPNHHLVVKNGCAATVMGPRENRHRPSVNTLFRSVARNYRSKVIGVVLSGALDDGAAGALAIKARGGTLIVEDPATAQVPEMPLNAMRSVTPDYRLPAAEIAETLTRLASEGDAIRPTKRPSNRDCVLETEPLDRTIEPQGITCPDCGGFLAEVGKGRTRQFRCHVGHSFSLESLSEGHADALERALWVALRKLNEQRSIQENLARVQTNPQMKKRFNEGAAAATYDMEKLHEIISRL